MCKHGRNLETHLLQQCPLVGLVFRFQVQVPLTPLTIPQQLVHPRQTPTLARRRLQLSQLKDHRENRETEQKPETCFPWRRRLGRHVSSEAEALTPPR